MKRIVLLIVFALLYGQNIMAKPQSTLPTRHSDAIVCIAQGIRFLVFPNGMVDLADHPPTRALRSRDHVQNYSRPKYGHPFRSAVRYDRHGRLRSVGPTTLSYNDYDQVRRIGNIKIRYNKRGWVSRVGRLRIYYDRFGHVVDYQGRIYAQGCGFCDKDNCDAVYSDFLEHDIVPPRHSYRRWKRKKRNDDDDDDDDD